MRFPKQRSNGIKLARDGRPFNSDPFHHAVKISRGVMCAKGKHYQCWKRDCTCDCHGE